MTLTKREREYVVKLAKRNRELKEKDKKRYQGLEIPMPPRERMMRKRIREKAKRMAIDLVLIEASGILTPKHMEGFTTVIEWLCKIRTIVYWRLASLR